MKSSEIGFGSRQTATVTPASSPEIQPDPYVALDDLMCVIEALCPVWTQRATSKPMQMSVL
jgi:hypothetical protein